MKKRISIPQPCYEKWSDMTEANFQSRFCNSCQKNVIDFTQKSDREVAEALYSTKGDTCGRFTKEQVEKSYKLPTKPSKVRKWAWASFVSGILVASQVQGQDKDYEYRVKTDTLSLIDWDIDTEVVMGDFAIEHDPAKSKAPIIPQLVTGIVRDKNGEPLKNVAVTVFQSSDTIMTNKEGEFSLSIPNNKADMLIFNHSGKKMKPIMIQPSPRTQHLDVTLEDKYEGVMGMIVAIPDGPPAPKRFTLAWYGYWFNRIADWMASWF